MSQVLRPLHKRFTSRYDLPRSLQYGSHDAYYAPYIRLELRPDIFALGFRYADVTNINAGALYNTRLDSRRDYRLEDSTMPNSSPRYKQGAFFGFRVRKASEKSPSRTAVHSARLSWGQIASED